MDNSIGHSSVSAPVANHTIFPRVFAPVEFPPEIWCDIAAVASADSVLTLRQISRDLRSIVDSIDQANLNRINQGTDSSVDLYQSDDGVRSVARDPATQRAMARDENISPALQEFFAHSNDAHVRWRLASNPSLSSDAAQQTLAQDQDEWVREALAGNSSLTSDAQQEALAQDQNAGVRASLAGNRSLTSDARQEALAQDQNAEVRASLARNSSLSSEAAQQTLAQDQNKWVRMALAGNFSLSSEAAKERLASDPNRHVRMFLRRIVPGDR
ncbi:MAG: hypothetical protein P8176_10570 [Gammaproteobacteria bacterium]